MYTKEEANMLVKKYEVLSDSILKTAQKLHDQGLLRRMPWADAVCAAVKIAEICDCQAANDSLEEQ